MQVSRDVDVDLDFYRWLVSTIFSIIIIILQHTVRGMSSPGPKSKLAMNSTRPQAHHSSWSTLCGPKEASPLVGNSMYSKTVPISNNLRIAIV